MDGIPVTGVIELVLEVADLERAEAFYTEVLGLPVVERWPSRDASWVLAGETRIGLWKPQVGLAGGRGGTHVHYAMHIDERDYDDAVARLRERGYEPEEHPFTRYDNSRAVFVTDPDGHVVELWTWQMSGYADL